MKSGVADRGRRYTAWWTEEVKEAIRSKSKKMIAWLRRRTPESRKECAPDRNKAKTIKG